MRLFIAFYFIGLIASLSPAKAGPWTLPQGEGLIITGIDLSQADSAYNSAGQEVASPDYTKIRSFLHGEYGLTPSLTGLFDLSGKSEDLEGPFGREFTGLDHARFGLRWKVWERQTYLLSLESQIGIEGDDKTINPFQVDNARPHGDLLAHFGYQRTFFGKPAFSSLAIGWRQSFHGGNSKLLTQNTLGLRPIDNWLILLQSLNNFDFSDDVDKQDDQKVSASLVYSFANGFSIQTGGFMTLSGHNTPAEQGLTLALWKRF
jgi:hypothetical protein